MKIYIVSQESDLFSEDRIYEQDGTMKKWIVQLFDFQDKLASESEPFNRILQSEIREDPEERLDSTNSPKSKVRNALLSKVAYVNPETKEFDQQAWEEHLRSGEFYRIQSGII